jgi:hypothetical protein
MVDQPAGLDNALERVIAAAREHLAAVKAADGAVDDEHVWRSYVFLNNASFDYDQLLLDTFGEVTPWDTEVIDTSRPARLLTESGVRIGDATDDPYPAVVSVRQRRDYRVPSLAALLASAAQAAARQSPDESAPAPGTVGDAVLALIRDSDGSMGGLDLAELEPLGGVLTVSELPEPRELGDATVPAVALFAVASGEQEVGRLDEQPYLTAGAIEEASADESPPDDEASPQ